MKTIAATLLLFLLGLALFLLSGTVGLWADNLFFHDEIRLSRAYGFLRQGNREAHEKALAEYILAGAGPKSARALALYNLGCSAVTRARQGDPAAVKDGLFYFKEALRNDPLLFPAKYNLELLVRTDEEKKAGGGGSIKEKEGEKENEREGKTEEGLTFPPPFLGSTP